MLSFLHCSGKFYRSTSWPSYLTDHKQSGIIGSKVISFLFCKGTIKKLKIQPLSCKIIYNLDIFPFCTHNTKGRSRFCQNPFTWFSCKTLGGLMVIRLSESKTATLYFPFGVWNNNELPSSPSI